MISSTLLTLLSLSTAITTVRGQVTATNPNGATNPSAPSYYAAGSTVDQKSMSRLLTLNGVDDFCIYGPPEAGPANTIGNTEPIVVAYCTKPRNGARLIPDGAITAAHFIKTPLYVQISGFWDGTKVNIPAGDSGGELDPHGAENLGNPIGGNVTSNVSGRDVFYEEWMSFVSYDQFCLRVCTAQTANVTTALQCEHELDIMGCQFVMAIGDFYSSDNSFTSCEGEPAAPPGLYPQADGSTSTFRQRYTGTYTNAQGTPVAFTVGQEVTPTAPAFYPATSNCLSYTSIANGINTANFAVTATPTPLTGGSSQSISAVVSRAASTSAVSSGSARTSGSSIPSGSASASGSARTSAAASSTGTSDGFPRAEGIDGLMIALGLGAIGVVAGAAGVLF